MLARLVDFNLKRKSQDCAEARHESDHYRPSRSRFRQDVVDACSSEFSASLDLCLRPRNSAVFDAAARIPRGGQSNHDEHQQTSTRLRHGDHRSRLGRHQGAENAVAAVVGVDLLRHLCGRSAMDRLSGVRRVTATQCMFNYSTRADVAVEFGNLERSQRQEVALGQAPLAETRRTRRSCAGAAASRPRSATTAAVTERARRQGLPEPTTTTGSGAAPRADQADHRVRRALGHGKALRATSGVRKDGMLKKDEIVTGGHYVRSLSGWRRGRRRLGAGEKLFADNCASARRAGQGQRRLGARQPTTILGTLGRGLAGRDHHQRPGPLMPAWTAARSGTIRRSPSLSTRWAEVPEGTSAASRMDFSRFDAASCAGPVPDRVGSRRPGMTPGKGRRPSGKR